MASKVEEKDERITWKSREKCALERFSGLNSAEKV